MERPTRVHLSSRILRELQDMATLRRRHAEEVKAFWKEQGYVENERPDGHGVVLESS